ncbi:hypothetical protein BaRGS_00037876 [Batillaria attramentaria]|uniref:Ankyrin repeat protein n=1 Tax=Batillaria attramentaria TaxID=370345 RepID=A0ABD0J7C9_9CAEN
MGQANSRQEAFWDACGFGRTHLVKKFIEEGIDINWVSFTHDCCPIHVASQGKPDVVKLLIEAKCDVNVQDSRGMTALHHAAMKGELDILQMLIEAGCELNTQDKNGWTALHNAAYWAHLPIVERLITSGASVGMANKHQRLPLHEVARSQSEDKSSLGRIARLLITAGSDVDALSSDFGEADFSSLMFAAYHGHTEVVNALIDADCDLNAYGSINKWTALHWAIERGHEDIVYLLIDAGADPCRKNMRGETAADRAQDQKMKEYLMNAINQQQQEDASLDRTSISSSQSFIAQTAHDTAVAIEKITAQSKSSASASSFVPVTMPPLAIATSEERKKNIKLGIRRQTSAGSASGPTSPGWSPGSAPHVELASDNMGDIPGNDRSIQLLRSFQDRLNRRIEKASKTLQGGLFRPEGTDPVITPSSSEASTREQTPASTAEGTSSSRERTPSSREATPSSREVTPSQGSESVGASGNESEEGEKATCNGQENVGVQNGAVNSDSDREGNNVIGEGGVGSLGSDMNACHLSEKQATEEKDSSSVKSEKSVHSNHSSLPPESSAAVNGSEKVVAPPESETTV